MDKMREEFEKAVVDGVIVGHLFGHEFAKSIRKTQVSDCFTCGKYQNDVLQLSWESWKASRAALCVELPMEYSDQFNEGAYFAQATRNALGVAGVTYK